MIRSFQGCFPRTSLTIMCVRHHCATACPRTALQQCHAALRQHGAPLIPRSSAQQRAAQRCRMMIRFSLSASVRLRRRTDPPSTTSRWKASRGSAHPYPLPDTRYPNRLPTYPLPSPCSSPLSRGAAHRLRIPQSYLYRTTDPLDPYSIRAAGYPLNTASRATDITQPQAPGRVPIRRPECVGGTAPGRWVTHQSLNLMVPMDPFEWRPYRCHYRHYTGGALRRCMEQIQGRIKLVGESTLGQLYELLLTHMNHSAFAWPYHIDIEMARDEYGWTDKIRGQGVHAEFHGLSVVLAHAKQELLEHPPEVIVQLQVANDAARDTLANYTRRMGEWIGILKELEASGRVAPRRHLWITPAVRHYKAGNGPGMAVCPEGTVESCVSVAHANHFVDESGETHWRTSPSQPPIFFGTLGRRKLFNRVALRMLREAFPEIEVVDFEAVTAALPSDYCIDGEHWGCNAKAWENRNWEPYQCKALGNVVLGEIFANTLCNGVVREDGGRVLSGDELRALLPQQ